MVAEPAWEHAVEIARAEPLLGVGLHVSISLDRSLLTPDQIPGLVDANGRFGSDPFRVGVRYALSRSVRAQLLIEIEAQFKRFAATGLNWSHADGHQHFHLHPAIWGHFMDLCDAHSVNRIRLPHEPVLEHLKSGGDRSSVNIAGLLAFRALRRRALRDLKRRSLNGRNYFVCDRVYGMLQTGNMNRDYLERLLPRLEGRTNEIYLHPGSPHSRRTVTDLTDSSSRDVEIDALLNSGLERLAESHNIQLGSYSEVQLMRAARPN
jgi:hopanoid biosynthesis associated protein HpnK